MALEDHKLPEDVKIGNTTFRKGCKLSTLVNSATAWSEIANMSDMSRTKKAEIFRANEPK